MQTDITMPAISLLMESVRLQDELPLLKARIPDAGRVFRQKAAQLAWDGPGDGGAGRVRVVAPQEGRVGRGPAEGHRPLLVRASTARWSALMDAGQIE